LIKAIDCWCNLFTADVIERFIQQEEFKPTIKWLNMEERWKGLTVDEMVAILDEAEVEKAFIPSFQLYSFQQKEMIWDITVEEVAQVVNERPDRFAGLYGINPHKKMDGVRELEKAVKDCGFKGAHLHAYGFGIPVNHRDLYPFYAKCVELDIPVLMQIGHSAESMPSAVGRPLLIDDFALYFPELKVVALHTGWPWVDELIAMAWKHLNVYIGTTGHRPKYWDPSLVRFLNSRGKGKVIWGTDYPLILHKQSRDDIEEMDLREDAKAQLLREVAIKIFKL
jgi:hypothetical protein